MSSQPTPTRTLPRRPSLAQLRKQAKELRDSYRAGDPAAVAEVEQFERHPDAANFPLATAQRVLARTYGYASWGALKAHVDGVNFEALLEAADAGDVETVRHLAAARPDLINPQHVEFQDSALHRAVLRGNVEMTRLLMELGADARVGIWPHRDATSAYAIAVDRELADIVAAIEQGEAQRRARLSPSGASSAAAIEALHQSIARGQSERAIALMEADPGLVTTCDVDGITALHLAAWKHDPVLVRWLLDRGASPAAMALCADPVQRDRAEMGSTPLDFAAIVAGWGPEGSGARFPFLENARVDPARLHETARMLLQRGAELTPKGAVALGDREAVRRLHRGGRLRNEVHLFRGGLLSIAVRTNQLDMLGCLLELGLDPDESVDTEDDARSWGMPLWFAAMCGRQECAELLLTRGADVNAIVYACGDALSMAADDTLEAVLRRHGARLTVEQVGDVETARAILDGRVPASSLNVDEPTHTDLAEQMLWANVGSRAEIVRLCLPHMRRKGDDPWWNYVLLHTRPSECLTLLLDHGVDPDVTSDRGTTCLHHLATDNVSPGDAIRLATVLLDRGASLCKRDLLLKSTALGWACRWGRQDLVDLYLQRGADPVERDADTWATPMAWATRRGHDEIVGRLRSHIAAAR